MDILNEVLHLTTSEWRTQQLQSKLCITDTSYLQQQSITK